MTRHLAVAAALVVSLFAAGASDVAGTTAKRPALRLVDRSPVTLNGQWFRPRERVRVTITSRGLRRGLTVTATARGTFVTEFALSLDPCLGLSARATGSSGSLAVYKLPQRLCPPA